MIRKADEWGGAGNVWIRLEAFKCNERGIMCRNLFGAAIALGADQLFFKPLWSWTVSWYMKVKVDSNKARP